MNGHYSHGGLYILLFPLGGGHYHHALYIHVSHPYGMHYHLTPSTPTSPSTLSYHLTEDIPTSRTIITALLIDPDIREHRLASAHNILVETPIPSTSTPATTPADAESASRAWVLSALTRLSAAVFGIDEPVAPLMEEAALLAAFAASNGSSEMRESRAVRAKRKEAEIWEVKRCGVSGCETCAMLRQRGCRDGGGSYGV